MEINEYQAREGDYVVITVVGIYQNEVIAVLEDKKIDNYGVIRSYMDLL